MYFLYKTYPVEYDYVFNQGASTILFLHGWMGNKDSFGCVYKSLGAKFNLLSISMPPHTASCGPLDMQDYKNLILEILKLYNLSSIIVICHSFGFRVCLMLASTNIKIEKLVVCGGAGIRFKPNFFKKLNGNFIKIFISRQPEYFNQFASTDYQNLSGVDKQTFKNIVNKDLTQYVKLLHCPIFLFWGKQDKSTTMKMFKKIKKLQPNALYKIVKNGDHFCYLFHKDLFIDCCQHFLCD